MRQAVILPWLDVGVKYAVLLYCMYYLCIRCVSENTEKSKYWAAAFFSTALGFMLIWLRQLVSPMHLVIMLMYVTLTNCLLFRNMSESGSCDNGLTVGGIAALSLLCFAFCHAIILIIGFVCSAFLSVVYEKLVPADRNSVSDFLQDIPVHIAAYIVMISLVWFFTYFAARKKRLRTGLMTIVRRRSDGTGILIALLLLAVGTAFMNSGAGNSSIVITTVLFIPTLLIGVVMIYWIKREISAEYVRRVRERNLTILEGSLAEKDKELDSLLSDSERLAEVIRSDGELLRLLIEKAAVGSDPQETAVVAEKVEELYSRRSGAVKAMERHGHVVCDTGDNSVDAVLRFMANIAESSGIDFDVDVKTDVGHLLGGDIDRRTFNTILADLAENAIISAGKVKERHVEVMFLCNDECLCLEVFDSGERFDLNVLKKMGSQRITTRACEGGSGIGLMTLFNALRNTGASFTIEEFRMGDGSEKFSKSVSVTFDHSSRLRIISDRAEELNRELRGRFEVIKKA